MMLRVLSLSAGILLSTLGLAAAQNATLVADTISFDGANRLVASGAVEVLYGSTRLKASRVVYNQATDKLSIEGPLTLVDGDTIVVADEAEISQDLRDGVLESARVVLAEQLQLAATEVNRVSGRYTQLYKVAVTSCHVCGADDLPLWQLRAKEIVHDQDARQLYFDSVQLRVLDIPVFYLPKLRLPDPTLDRAAGFLVPSLRTNSQLGTGLKLPYFIPIGDDKDLTLTPYFSSSTATIEFRYRQAFASGDLNVRGALTDDDLVSGQRSYLFADGSFDLGRDYTLSFNIEQTSDDTYLIDYGYNAKDRLDSAISLERVREDDAFDATLTYFKSLRSGEQTSTLPPLVGDLRYTKRLNVRDGTLDLSGDIHAHQRFSGTDATVQSGATPFSFAPAGRDVTRLSAAALYQKGWVMGGLAIDFDARFDADIYTSGDDLGEADTLSRATPASSITLRYPLAKNTDQATHILEPVLQISWADTLGDTPRNEDSTRSEFDEGNLLSFSRFSGQDAVETGLRTTVGLNYARTGKDGWHYALSAGKSFRANTDDDFAATTGLANRSSDWLLAAQVKFNDALTLTNRAVVQDDLTFQRNDLRLSYQTTDWRLASSYYWSQADADLPNTDFAELTLDGSYRFDRYWSAQGDLRYDFNEGTAARAGFGVSYENECIVVGAAVSRRFTSSTNLDPTTDFDLTVSLKGFSTGRSRGTMEKSHRCN